MNKLSIIISESNKFASDLQKTFTADGIESTLVPSELYSLQLRIIVDKPTAAIIFDKSTDYKALVSELKNTKLETKLFVISNKLFSKEANLPNVNYIENCENAETVAHKIELLLSDEIAEHERFLKETNDFAYDLIRRTLNELGFTANYSGTAYIKKILEAFYNEEIDTASSMSKVIYPFAAKVFNTTSYSIERGIRTAISRCLNRSEPETRSKYLGSIFSDTSKCPTNREFLLVLYDALEREIWRFEG